MRVEARFAGLEAVGPVGNSAGVAPGQTARFEFPVTVNGDDSAMIEIAASMDAHRDTVQVEIPIRPSGPTRRDVAHADVTDTARVAVSIPAARTPGTEALEVVVATTRLGRLKDSVGYLMGYPNGCIEQTTSRAYPLVVLEDLLPEIGVEVDGAKLREYAEAGVRRILSFQTTSGGLSYWPGRNEPHAFATAFGLTALIEGKKRGYAVPDRALDGMADYLERILRDGRLTGEMPHGGAADGDTRAFFVMTLGRLGRPQTAYIDALWRARTQLTPFGLAFLAVAHREAGGDAALDKTMLAAVRQPAEETPSEAWYPGSRAGGWSFGSPLRTHAAALLAHAGTDSGRANKVAGKLLNGLLARQVGGMWGNTQENVFGIMGVAALAADEGRDASMDFELRLGDRAIDLASLEVVSPRVRRLRVPAIELGAASEGPAIQRVELSNRRGGSIALMVRASWRDRPDVAAEPVARGIEIARSMVGLDGAPVEPTAVPLGAVVRVDLRVHNPLGRHYVAIDDRLPAGFEPMNTALATTARVDDAPASPERLRAAGVTSHTEIRDDRVAFYADDLPGGIYVFSYLARATTPGRFLRPPATAEAMYDPDVAARTAVAEVRVVSPMKAL